MRIVRNQPSDVYDDGPNSIPLALRISEKRFVTGKQVASLIAFHLAKA